MKKLSIGAVLYSPERDLIYELKDKVGKFLFLFSGLDGLDWEISEILTPDELAKTDLVIIGTIL
jgi:hypothetical protein